jgi:hypothetical protein
VTAELVPGLSIETLVMQRDAMVERIEAAHRSLVEADELAVAMFGDMHGRLALLNYHGRRREFTSEDGLGDMVKQIDGRAWSYLLDKSGLRTFMDHEARAKWDDAIEKNDVPPLTVYAIKATFASLYEQRGEMFERGVEKLFRSLSWDYKTNNPVMFGKRLVMRHVVDVFRCHNVDRLDDLVRALSVLDGKPEPDHRSSVGRRLSDARWPWSAPVMAFDYFTVRGFKNGNAHLTFTRPDLVDRLNQILARRCPGALPCSREAE